MGNLAAYVLGMLSAKCQNPRPDEQITHHENVDGTTTITYLASVNRALIGFDPSASSHYMFAVDVDADGEQTVSPADIRGLSVAGQVADGDKMVTPFLLGASRQEPSGAWLVHAEALQKTGDASTNVTGVTDLQLSSDQVRGVVGQAQKTIASGVNHQPLGVILPDQPKLLGGLFGDIFR